MANLYLAVMAAMVPMPPPFADATAALALA